MLNLRTRPPIFSRDKQEGAPHSGETVDMSTPAPGCKLRVSATDEHPRLLKSSNAVFRDITARDTKMKMKLDFV